jgi:cell wall-associated NlpC family hydrolase
MPKHVAGYDPAASIEGFLKSKGSPLAPHAKTFVAAGKKYGVDPHLVVAISGIESSFGKHIFGQHNAWGWGPGKPFGSWDEGISAVTQGLRTGYYDRGLRTPEQIVNRYAPASDGNDTGNWVQTVTQFMKEMGAANVPTPSSQALSPPKVTPIPAPPSFRSVANLRNAALQNLLGIAQGGEINPQAALQNLTAGVALDRQAEAQAQAWGGTTIAAEPASVPRGNTAQSTPRVGGKMGQAIEIAKQQIGKPYVFGAAGPKSFDCSGLIEYAFEQAGIKTPGRMTTGTMMKLGRSVKGTPMEPGDWLVRHDGQQQHVVMYVGNGQVIAAPHTGEVVQYQPADRFTGAGWDVRRYP